MLDKQLAWKNTQNMQVVYIDRDPLHNGYPNNDEYMVRIHNISNGPTSLTNQTLYPLSQAKELFPAAIA
jgi:hypothetical protein